LRSFLRKKRNHHRIDILLDKVVGWINYEAYNERFEATSSAVLIDAAKRYNVASRLVRDNFVQACTPAEHPYEDHDTLFFVKSETNAKVYYRVCLRYMSCSCPDYIHHGRCCKHIYAGALVYLKQHKLKPAIDNPFHVIQLIHVHVNYPRTYKELYASWNQLFPTTNVPVPLAIGAPPKRNNAKLVTEFLILSPSIM